ncbi:MAG: hypothetical protein EBT15_06875 [Betaproteobacteria bacterium]|nr:hypothetical protein [Betaproteobacteria bacterium]
MSINKNPLDQRLDSILPDAAPVSQPVEAALEPMPADQTVELPPPIPTEEIGTPSMADGVQVAGLFTKITGGIAKELRETVTKQAPNIERNLIPKAAEGEVANATKVGRFKMVQEADQQLTDKVGAAVETRKATGNVTGKPPEEAFNLANASGEDAAAVIGGVADALGIKTTKVTFDQIKAKAAENGVSEAFLSRLIAGDGKMLPSAVETYKALEVLDSSAKELDRLFKLVADGQATEAQQLQLRQQITLHGLIQKGVKGIQTETARALAVMRIPREGNIDLVRQVLDEYGGQQSLQDMATKYLSIESRAARNALVEKSMFSSVKDVWFTTYINGLLSSPVSHAKNVVSNTLFGLYQIPERLVASFYSNVLPDGVRSWKALVPGSEAEKVGYDEALTMAQSLRNGLLEGFELASKAWKNNAPNSLGSKIEMQRNPQEGLGETLQRLTGQNPDTWMGKALGYYGTAITVPGRALMTEDEFFKGVLYRMELNAQVTRRGKQIYRDGVEAGLSETDAMAKASLEVERLFTNPPKDLDDAALAFAQKGTFTAELPSGLKSLQQVFNHPALKVVVPFFKTPANISLEVIERTPFAPLSSQWREELAKGGIYRDMAMAKVTLGSAVLATFAAMSSEGLITGRGPERKADREAMMRDGWMPYSLKVGDKYYSYNGMEPVSALMAIAADYAEYAKHEPDSDKVEQVFLGATYGLYEYLKEQPYLQGIADVAKLVGTNQQGQVDGKKVVDGLVKQFGGFVIGGSPAGAYNSLVASIERLLDPAARDARASPDLPMGVRGFVEAFNRYRSRLPYFNADLPEQLNLWGDPILQSRGKAYELVLPTKVSPAQFSEVDDALVRIGSPVGMPERKIDGVEMDAFQYNRLLTIYGKELPSKNAIMEVITTPGFDLMSLDDQQKSVQRIHSRFMDVAKKQLIQEDPALKAKIDELQELRKANGLYYKP